MAAGRKYEAVDDDETGTGKATRAPEKAIRTPEKALGARAVARSELGLIWNIAWPTGISTLLRAGTQQSTVMIVGHMLGAEALGAVGLGTMWVNISGLSIVFGGMSALDTLCSQAYGAQNYKLVGLWAQRGLMIIWMLCVPIFFLWFFGTRSVLAVLGIDEAQAELAQQFTRIQCLWMLPVFMNRTIQTYWRAFRVVKPYKNATIIGFIFHVPVCYAMTFQFGFLGAAWSLPINQWLLFCTCIAIDKCQGISAKCWPRWSVAALRGWGPLLRMGSAGTLTTMGEWWSWEICAGMAGTLGAIPLAAHITIQNFSFFYFPLPFSVSMGATIRVGQLLGAGSPENAKLVLKISLCVTNAIMFTCAAIVWTFRSDFAAIYTADAEVIAKVAGVVDVYVFFILLGGSTQCLRGVLAGCGRQAINARVSLLASYGVGLPISYTMCFQLGWGLAGLWLGLVCSNIFRTLCLMYITFRQDWQALSDTAVAKAAEKVGEQEEKKSILAPGDSGSDSD